MGKRLPIVFRTIVLPMAWAVFLFLQHVVCFDLFGINRWHFYLSAGIYAMAQYLILFIVGKYKQMRWLLIACCFAYIIVSTGKLLQLLTAFAYDRNPVMLTAWCFFLDIIGVVLSIRLRKRCCN